MKNKKMILVMAIIVVLTFSTTACFGQNNSGGGRTFNNAEDLKKYLDSQPANSPDKPIKVTMSANSPMLPKITEAINSAGKYVNLNLAGNILTTIPDGAFRTCEMLVGITIPDSVTSIGEHAFGGTGLSSVIIPNSVISIGENAFEGCKFNSVTLGNNVKTIEDYSFYSCENLTSIIIPNSVTSIGVSAFKYCANLNSVTFQGTITSNDLREHDKLAEYSTFDGDLRTKYLAGGIGTYTRPNGSKTWTKQ